ncbi:DUF2933 domain-containing protein [Nonomuraea dietziae]|uniref:DUF2933 domain-containing protein n=1 Tax=Nonomuraea dietziae TaxID=65515 RepID=UPI00342FDD1C
MDNRTRTSEVAMVKQHMALAAVAAVIAIGAIWAGAPPGTVLPAVFLLGCPLMMLLMMRSMKDQGGHARHHHPDGEAKRS